MKITLRFFSSLRGRFKVAEGTFELERPQTAKEIFMNLFDDREAADKILASIRSAVNCEYVSHETLVREGDEVAFIPPVSGG